jgi:hypothetical protein
MHHATNHPLTCHSFTTHHPNHSLVTLHSPISHAWTWSCGPSRAVKTTVEAVVCKSHLTCPKMMVACIQNSEELCIRFPSRSCWSGDAAKPRHRGMFGSFKDRPWLCLNPEIYAWFVPPPIRTLWGIWKGTWHGFHSLSPALLLFLPTEGEIEKCLEGGGWVGGRNDPNNVCAGK